MNKTNIQLLASVRIKKSPKGFILSIKRKNKPGEKCERKNFEDIASPDDVWRILKNNVGV